MPERFGALLPNIRTPPPGPRSRELAGRLAAVESRNITAQQPDPPIFWAAARGANVRDADGNTYVDLTAGFSVAAAGHANRAVVRAASAQMRTLAHALGDVHPAEIKVHLLARLASIAPGALDVAILASAGAEAVEAALKTALLYTGRPGILAFENGYHGLTYGALAATWRSDFRAPFEKQLYAGVSFAPYPRAGTPIHEAMRSVHRMVDEAQKSDTPIGCVIIEPVQGRGGIVVPPPGFLPALRALCDEQGIVLIFDEIYCGMGRTGRWFACQQSDTVPDILVIGKALTGMLPLSAAIGTREVMSAWPASTGEAIHTSTFLGNPVACAAALAQIEQIEHHRLVERAASLGAWLRKRLEEWRRLKCVVDVRGYGLMQGVELRSIKQADEPLALSITRRLLHDGILMLAEGTHAEVIAFTPPLTIKRRQLRHALDVIEQRLTDVDAG
jgi:4-aminobutyrate aminotransferase/(S)-3-amino-2-methylpropionate transaminase